jgi:hypothetical protein
MAPGMVSSELHKATLRLSKVAATSTSLNPMRRLPLHGWPASGAIELVGIDLDIGDDLGLAVAQGGKETAAPAGMAGDADLVD